jgi:serine-type D-Ala-D-Ala carboxypeptidase (penicillin-binding protein 5/6)
VYQGPLKPPIKTGDAVGMLRVTSSSGASHDVALYAAADVQPGGIVRRGLDSLAHLAEKAVGWGFSKLKPAPSQASP